MKNGTLTYAELVAKLKTYGYTRRRCEVEGKAAQLFEHESIQGASFLLPDAPPDQEVETPFMNKVCTR